MAKKQKQKTKKVKQKRKTKVPIEHVFPDGQEVIFSNYLTVQWDRGNMHVSFFEIRPPILLGSESEREKAIKDISSVQARCRTRVVMSLEKAKRLIDCLVTQVGKAEKGN